MKIIHQRNVYILYPRNFGTSDHSDQFGWEDVASTFYATQMTSPDLCMKTESPQLLWVDTVWEEKLPWLLLATILIKLQDTLVWIPPLWNNTTTNLSDNSETMYKV
jgi:hypothetical protein